MSLWEDSISILDDIDALIDEQLDAGEPLGGYDCGDPDFPSCGHCRRDWHGLAITARMEQMRWRGAVDDDYRYADDDSRVICPGSEFIGPVVAPECCSCAQCVAWRAAVDDGDPHWTLPNDPFSPAVSVFPEFEFTELGERARRAGDAFLGGLTQFLDVLRRSITGPLPVDTESLESAGWQPLGFVQTPNPGARTERRSDDPHASRRENERRNRQRRAERQEQPVWAARMDGRRARR